MPEDFVVTDENLSGIIADLKLYGGHEGWRIAHLLTDQSALRISKVEPVGFSETVPAASRQCARAAVSKVLAAAGRPRVRDIIDLMYFDRKCFPLGIAIWAAAGTEKSLTPDFLIYQLRRNSLINPFTLDGEKLAVDLNPVALKAEWLASFSAAERLMATIPNEPIGCLYLDSEGRLPRGSVFDSSWKPYPEVLSLEVGRGSPKESDLR